MELGDSIVYIFFGAELNWTLTRNIDSVLTDSYPRDSTAVVYLKERDAFASALEQAYPGRLRIEDPAGLVRLRRPEQVAALPPGVQIVVCVSPKVTLHPHFDRVLRRYLNSAKSTGAHPSNPVPFGWSHLRFVEELPEKLPPRFGVVVATHIHS